MPPPTSSQDSSRWGLAYPSPRACPCLSHVAPMEPARSAAQGSEPAVPPFKTCIPLSVPPSQGDTHELLTLLEP